jgi:hypothetical protein
MNQITPSGKFVTLVHFTYLAAKEDFSENEEGEPWRIACMPKMREFHATPYHPNYQRTNEPKAVTCPACKETNIYKQMSR